MNIPWVRLYKVDFIVGRTPWSAAGPLASLFRHWKKFERLAFFIPESKVVSRDAGSLKSLARGPAADQGVCPTVNLISQGLMPKAAIAL